MNIIKSKTFTATVTIGLEKGFSGEVFGKNLLILALQDYQNKRIQENGIYLSASVSECEIVLSGQCEKHIRLDFINYPKFSLTKEVFKTEIIKLATYLINELNQIRTVIVFPDETVMLEKDLNIDPRIQ